MKSFDAVIALWPSDAEFARDVGIRPNHLQTMKVRGSIPPEYWLRIVRAAAARRIRGVTMEALGVIAEARAKGRNAAA